RAAGLAEGIVLVLAREATVRTRMGFPAGLSGFGVGIDLAEPRPRVRGFLERVLQELGEVPPPRELLERLPHRLEVGGIGERIERAITRRVEILREGFEPRNALHETPKLIELAEERRERSVRLVALLLGDSGRIELSRQLLRLLLDPRELVGRALEIGTLELLAKASRLLRFAHRGLLERVLRHLDALHIGTAHRLTESVLPSSDLEERLLDAPRPIAPLRLGALLARLSGAVSRLGRCAVLAAALLRVDRLREDLLELGKIARLRFAHELLELLIEALDLVLRLLLDARVGLAHGADAGEVENGHPEEDRHRDDRGDEGPQRATRHAKGEARPDLGAARDSAAVADDERAPLGEDRLVLSGAEIERGAQALREIETPIRLGRRRESARTTPHVASREGDEDSDPDARHDGDRHRRIERERAIDEDEDEDGRRHEDADDRQDATEGRDEETPSSDANESEDALELILDPRIGRSLRDRIRPLASGHGVNSCDPREPGIE